ncbi:MAG TPA: ribose-5-phosphate isomerase RpiA [Gammaproteobacteria bacterium]|nr:ribose-5-phosphate isomerase RpiA [Gammaproteobacteria bacterium]
MNEDNAKRRVAETALEYLRGCEIVGVGTGSTVAHFIAALAGRKQEFDGAVASSEASANLLRKAGIRLLDLNATGPLPVYVDGADEATRHGQLIKGGGGALTREKILAAVSRRFVCMIHRPKLVDVLGGFGLPIEVIPMARSYVARELVARGGQPEWRKDFITDNGNVILDVKGLEILDPSARETELNQIAGVVTVGLFARRRADILLVGDDGGVETLTP